MTSYRWRVLSVLAGIALLAGCAGESASPAPPSQPASSSATPPPTSKRLPPEPKGSPTTPAEPTSSAEPATTTPAEGPASGGCGTVTAASGLTLEVMPGDGASDCAQAERVVAAFHKQIAGQQSSDSRHPVSATVDGWDCVSGPPSSHGGTTCSKGGVDVMAAVVIEE